MGNNNNKVNTATITKIGIAQLSDYHKASLAMRVLREKYLSDKKEAEKALSDAKAKRDELVKSGKTEEEAINLVSLAKLYGKLDALKDTFHKDCEPYVKAQNEVVKLVSDNFYPAYVLAMAKGDYAAHGKVTITTGKKSVEYQLDKSASMKAIIRVFVEELGVTNTDNDRAMDKLCKTISVRVGGMKKDSETGLLKVKSKSDMRHLLVRAVIQYLVEDRHALTIAEDGTISK